jgi:hypothetical protein
MTLSLHTPSLILLAVSNLFIHSASATFSITLHSPLWCLTTAILENFPALSISSAIDMNWQNLVLVFLVDLTHEHDSHNEIGARVDDRRGIRWNSNYRVIITNWCQYDIYYTIAGPWKVTEEGAKNRQVTLIEANGGVVQQKYFISCPLPLGCNGCKPAICKTTGQLAGAGVSIKFMDETQNVSNMLQLEYTLISNPNRGDDFLRLDYDISLLDCARIDNVTDAMAMKSKQLNNHKVSGCPGYQNGLALWYDDSTICRPVYCDGLSYCDGIYNYDRTRIGEMSLACDQPYDGDMHFELCVGNGDGYVHY